mgnify:CR=1 FL=1
MRVSLVQVSLQKRGAAALDSFCFSNSLLEEHVPHAAVISASHALRSRFRDDPSRTVIAVPTYGSGVMSFLFHTLAFFRPLAFLIRVIRLHPRLVYATHFHPWLPLLFVCKKPFGFSVAYAVHENPFDPKERASRFGLLLERICIRLADHVVTHSLFVAGALRPHIPTKPMHTVPLGAYSGFCAPVLRAERSLAPLRLLFMGRIEDHKGLIVLLAAFRAARERGAAIFLTVAGDGPLSSMVLRDFEGPGIRLERRWIGDDELCLFLADADIVVLPYLRATQSGVISHALASGLPVIASRVGGLPEQVIHGTTGLLVAPGDSADLADAIPHGPR